MGQVPVRGLKLARQYNVVRVRPRTSKSITDLLSTHASVRWILRSTVLLRSAMTFRVPEHVDPNLTGGKPGQEGHATEDFTCWEYPVVRQRTSVLLRRRVLVR